MVRPDPETGSFQVRTQERDVLHNSQTVHVLYGSLLFYVVHGAGPVTNSRVTSVFCFVKDDKPDFLFVSICVDCAQTLAFRYRQDWWYYECPL